MNEVQLSQSINEESDWLLNPCPFKRNGSLKMFFQYQGEIIQKADFEKNFFTALDWIIMFILKQVAC